MLKTVQREQVKPKSPLVSFCCLLQRNPVQFGVYSWRSSEEQRRGKKRPNHNPPTTTTESGQGLRMLLQPHFCANPGSPQVNVSVQLREWIPVTWRKYWQPLRLGSQDPGDICGDKVVASFTKALWGRLPVLVKCSEILREKVLNKPLSTAAPRGLGWLGINNSVESNSINIPISQIWLIWGQSLKLSFSSDGN